MLGKKQLREHQKLGHLIKVIQRNLDKDQLYIVMNSYAIRAGKLLTLAFQASKAALEVYQSRINIPFSFI